MGIRDEIQAEIADAFDTDLADAVHDFTGYIETQEGWNPVTETGADPLQIYVGRGVLAGYSLNRVDGINILHGDVKLIALANEVNGTPSEGHLISAPDLATGKRQMYRIVGLSADPASATYRMQLRRK